jgi:hypothetical protein
MTYRDETYGDVMFGDMTYGDVTYGDISSMYHLAWTGFLVTRNSCMVHIGQELRLTVLQWTPKIQKQHHTSVDMLCVTEHLNATSRSRSRVSQLSNLTMGCGQIFWCSRWQHLKVRPIDLHHFFPLVSLEQTFELSETKTCSCMFLHTCAFLWTPHLLLLSWGW